MLGLGSSSERASDRVDRAGDRGDVLVVGAATAPDGAEVEQLAEAGVQIGQLGDVTAVEVGGVQSHLDESGHAPDAATGVRS